MKFKLIILLSAVFLYLNSALIMNQPMIISNPDGTEIECFASGDEYFNYLHDENDYTIIRSTDNGYYYYATRDNGRILASQYLVGSVNPETVGLERKILISQEEYNQKRDFYLQYMDRNHRVPTTGLINNLVVYIRFSDQDEFESPRSFFDAKFNDQSANAVSMYNYYQEVSYQTLEIDSYHFPVCEMTTNLSYQDIYPRSYFCSYNPVTAPDGYTNDYQKVEREHQLLVRAINAIADEVPQDLEIDVDDNGNVDNVCFIVKGNSEAWADLLWAHRWVLYSENVYIHGKKVYDFTFQPENQNSVTTLNHEMFHVLGAPDLYRYNSGTGYSDPIGQWDIMAGGSGHMMAYMKYRYGYWIDDIPIVSSGETYWLKPLTSPSDNVYRVNSPNSVSEYFLIEYRKQQGSYESNLPGSGIIISRVNDAVSGQGNADGPPDELYCFRPNGNLNSDGSLNNAYFSLESGRTEFSANTNPYPFLNDGSPGGIFISCISSAADSISFVFDPQLGFLNTVITTDFEVDITEAIIRINNEIYHPNADGLFSIPLYQGNHQVLVEMEGFTSYNSSVEVLPFQDTTIEINLSYLIPPTNLTHEFMTENQVNISWDFDNYEDEEFENFSILMSLDGNHFSQIQTSVTNSALFNINPSYTYHCKIKAVYSDGISYSTNTIQFSVVETSEESENLAVNSLRGNYPNPFNPVTEIRFDLAGDNQAYLEIFNLKGQRIVAWDLSEYEKGQHSIKWNGKDSQNHKVSSGIYFYRLSSPNRIQQKKMILLK
ncbi:MAG: M6 family metalloprotease domain-containing protein [Candidatus Cloacimonetes bacterium]|nr:M6 family metalloprotease domain-containing protein [Candidatus Cloacimonadota bacterium]